MKKSHKFGGVDVGDRLQLAECRAGLCLDRRDAARRQLADCRAI
jgi:hypothetical protein